MYSAHPPPYAPAPYHPEPAYHPAPVPHHPAPYHPEPHYKVFCLVREDYMSFIKHIAFT